MESKGNLCKGIVSQLCDMVIWPNGIPSAKLTWQWKTGPFEDVFPTENGDVPLPAMLVYRSVICQG